MDGQSKAIELQGIVHNETKIGVKDGMCEDLINLRFKDGSWRASGDGKCVYNLTDTYEQLYVHTNVYRHLFGVKYNDADKKEGTLYWIANIVDGVFETLPEPIALTSIVGSVSITQTGHLITIIDEADDFEYFVFKTNTNEYKEAKVDANGDKNSRAIFPFGEVHFNWYSPEDEEHVIKTVMNDWGDIGTQSSNWYDDYNIVKKDVPWTVKQCHDQLVVERSKAQKKNKFTSPFGIICALRLYDGSYAFCSNPTIIFPRQKIQGGTVAYFADNYQKYTTTEDDKFVYIPEAWMIGENPIYDSFFVLPAEGCFTKNDYDDHNNGDYNGFKVYSTKHYPSFENGSSAYRIIENPSSPSRTTTQLGTDYVYTTRCADIVISINNSSILQNNEDLFSELCVFITPEVDLFYLGENDWKESPSFKYSFKEDLQEEEYKLHHVVNNKYTHRTNKAKAGQVCWSYIPKTRSNSDIIRAIMNSNFYLLKEYNKNTIVEIANSGIINLDGDEYEGLLENINKGVATERLSSESLDRKSYIPNVSYSYNGRLHIADYKSSQFNGYPLDCFIKNNHSVRIADGSSWFGLKNIQLRDDSYYQWERDARTLLSDNDLKNVNAPTMFAVATIDTANGEQKVSRCIRSTDENLQMEDLDLILTFPDYRAKYLDIYYVIPKGSAIQGKPYIIKHKRFDLQPSRYLNLAYYVNKDLKPEKLSDFTSLSPIINSIKL